MVSATRATIWRTELLALGRAERAAEVLLDHDVGRGLRPRLGELDAALLEEHLAVGAGDHRVAALPLDGLERIDALAREEALEGEARALVLDDARRLPCRLLLVILAHVPERRQQTSRA